MKFLLDTHIFINLVEQRTERLGHGISELLRNRDAEFFLSVASLWEIAIKSRLGKLPLGVELGFLPEIAAGYGLAVVPIGPDHALARLKTNPPTNDPFDRLLLAQCQVEGLRLVTVDRALVDHSLAARSP